MPDTQLMFRSAIELAAMVRAGELSASELVQSSLRRISELNPALNAFVDVDEEGALRAAEGVLAGDARPFAGVPIAIKNNRAVAGSRLTLGCSLLADYVAARDHSVVRRLKGAGFVIVGTTTLPEYGILPTTEARLFGPTRNPWDRERSPGGSSGGAAAAVAAGMVPVAHGNDGGGSIRIPAACCGLVGLKPSRGRVSAAPELGDSALTVDGVLTRTVADTAAILDVLAGYETGDATWAPPPSEPFALSASRPPLAAHAGGAGLRIAMTTLPPVPEAVVDPLCAQAVTQAAGLLRSLGHRVEEVDPPWQVAGLSELFGKAFSIHVALSIAGSGLLAGRAPTASDMEPMSWEIFEAVRRMDAVEGMAIAVRLQSFARRLVTFLDPYDALLTPALAERPLPLGTLDTAAPEPMATFTRSGLFTPFTPVFNASGQPGVSLPLYEGEDGLPLAVQLVGRPAGESALLALAAQLEGACPWTGRRAPAAAVALLTGTTGARSRHTPLDSEVTMASRKIGAALAATVLVLLAAPLSSSMAATAATQPFAQTAVFSQLSGTSSDAVAPAVKAGTTTRVTESAVAVNYGNESSVQFTAEVTGGDTEGESVEVKVDSGANATTCTVHLTAGVGKCAIEENAALPAAYASYAVSAHYAGDASLEPSDGTVAGGLTITGGRTVTTVAVNPAKLTYGAESPVTVTASVVAEGNTPLPSGETAHIRLGTESCPVTLGGGADSTGSCTISTTPELVPGSYAATAEYPGDLNLSESTSTNAVSLKVEASPTSFTITVNNSETSRLHQLRLKRDPRRVHAAVRSAGNGDLHLRRHRTVPLHPACEHDLLRHLSGARGRRIRRHHRQVQTDGRRFLLCDLRECPQPDRQTGGDEIHDRDQRRLQGALRFGCHPRTDRTAIRSAGNGDLHLRRHRTAATSRCRRARPRAPPPQNWPWANTPALPLRSRGRAGTTPAQPPPTRSRSRSKQPRPSSGSLSTTLKRPPPSATARLPSSPSPGCRRVQRAQ